MMLSKRALLIVVMMIVALVSVACGGGGGGSGTTGDATGVAKTFIEGVFKGDANAIRSVLCEAAKSEFTDEAFQTLTEGLATMNSLGGEIILTGLTYTYNSDAKVVNLGGEIKVKIEGQEMPLPISVNDMFGSNGIPVREDGGKWTVCLTD